MSGKRTDYHGQVQFPEVMETVPQGGRHGL